MSAQAIPIQPADFRTRDWLLTRSSRVIALFTVVIVLSLYDLHITLLYAQSVGMPEANPLARWVMGFDSPAMVAAYKLLTLVIAGGILIPLRRKRAAEIGAWVCAFVLVWLTLRWSAYTQEMHLLGTRLIEISQFNSGMWVQMSP